jgi:ACS family glucarate transporter-like MFS transporter
MAGFLVSAAGVSMIPGAAGIREAAAWFTVAAFGAEMVISPSWAHCMDIGGARSGAVTGAMNMAGNIGSFVCANLFPMLASWTGSPDTYFWTVLALDLAAAACGWAMRGGDNAHVRL